MDSFLQWSEMFAKHRRTDQQGGRNLLTESFGQQKAFRDGASFSEGLQAGAQEVDIQQDPLFNLKKQGTELLVAQQAAKLADIYRQVKLEDQRLSFEQEDQNFLTKAALESNGDIKAYEDKVLRFSPKSLVGMREQQTKLSFLSKARISDTTSKMFNKLDIKSQLAVNQMLQETDGEWTPEIYQFASEQIEKNTPDPGKVISESIQLPNGQGEQTILRHEKGKAFIRVDDPQKAKAERVQKILDRNISGMTTDLRRLRLELDKAKAKYNGELEKSKGRTSGTTLDLKKLKGEFDSLQKRYDEQEADLNALRTEPEKSEPATIPAPTGLAEGQKVRNKITGKTGTVVNGAIVPDE